MNEYKSVVINSKKVSELEPLLNFLFIVHNEIEMNEMQNNLNPITGYGVILDYIEEDCMQHFYIGKFFKYNIVLTKTSDMGSINVNSSINIINRAIQIFKPNYIIMPGISAGLDEKLKIGDVVIADKIIGYESEKLASTEIIGRYPEFRSPRLYNLFCSANICCFNNFIKDQILKDLKEVCIKDYADSHSTAKDGSIEVDEEFAWDKFIVNDCFPKVYTGNYISGEKLLDNPICRNNLKLKFKEALALDMEGVGVASASAFNRVYDWLVIKGISDLGDGNKNKNKVLNQIFAMKNVVLALKKVFDNELSFSEINLKQARNFIRKNVLISASQCANGDFHEITEVFVETLARQLILNQYNVLTGYGLNIGPAVMYGILDGCDQLGLSLHNYIERFQTFPFPRKDSKDDIEQERVERCKVKNREILCSNTNIALFVFGNKIHKKQDDKIADGMLQELELANKNKALIMPIGCTKGTAKMIYETVLKNTDKYLKPYFSEKSKYGVGLLNIEKEIENYITELTNLNKIILENGNIDSVIKKIIELINLYG